jgi:hypothetical protein
MLIVTSKVPFKPGGKLLSFPFPSALLLGVVVDTNVLYVPIVYPLREYASSKKKGTSTTSESNTLVNSCKFAGTFCFR